jgi:hypothetical protein
VIDRLGDPDARTSGDFDRRCFRPRKQLERRTIEHHSIMLSGNAHRLAEFSGAGAQLPHILNAAPPLHGGEAGGRLDRPDQHRACAALPFAHEIHTPVDAIGAIDIDKPGRPEHHGITLGLAAVRVGSRIGVVISLDLHDHPADRVDEKRCANEVGRNVMDTAVEEGPRQFPLR